MAAGSPHYLCRVILETRQDGRPSSNSVSLAGKRYPAGPLGLTRPIAVRSSQRSRSSTTRANAADSLSKGLISDRTVNGGGPAADGCSRLVDAHAALEKPPDCPGFLLDQVASAARRIPQTISLWAPKVRRHLYLT